MWAKSSIMSFLLATITHDLIWNLHGVMFYRIVTWYVVSLLTLKVHLRLTNLLLGLLGLSGLKLLIGDRPPIYADLI